MLEKDIERLILEYLSIHGWLAWKNPTVGVFDQSRGKFRKPSGKFHMTGVSDIIAVRNGEVWFIEVKTKRGRQTDNQKLFERLIGEKGGNYLLARSVDDVKFLAEV